MRASENEGSPVYRDGMPRAAYAIAKLGGTNAQIAEGLGVSLRTLTGYLASGDERYAELQDAVESGKGEADGLVQQSLFRRATGYEYEATHFASYQGAISAMTYREHVVPDIAAQMHWLKNRRPTEWRDKPEGAPARVIVTPLDGKSTAALEAALALLEGEDAQATDSE